MRRRAASSAALAIVVSLVVGATAVGGWFVVNSSSGTKAAGTSITTASLVPGATESNGTQILSSSYANGTVTLTIIEVSTTTVTQTVTLSAAPVTVTTTVTANNTATKTQPSQSTQSEATVVVGPVLFPASDFSMTSGNSQFTCTTGGGIGAWLKLSVTDLPPQLALTSLAIVWNGQTSSFTPSGVCYMGPAPDIVTYVSLPAGATLGSPAVSGQPFVGVLTFSDGASVTFTADWQ